MGPQLEMLGHDVTLVGLQHLLVHYDIPILDTAEWRLEIDATSISHRSSISTRHSSGRPSRSG